jgi:hypothetical protein
VQYLWLLRRRLPSAQDPGLLDCLWSQRRWIDSDHDASSLVIPLVVVNCNIPARLKIYGPTSPMLFLVRAIFTIRRYKPHNETDEAQPDKDQTSNTGPRPIGLMLLLNEDEPANREQTA